MHEAQILRMNEEIARLREVLVECRGRDNETQSLVADLRLSLADLQQKVSYEGQYDRSIGCSSEHSWISWSDQFKYFYETFCVGHKSQLSM